MGSKGDVTFASLTDVGLVRDHNEDYYGFFEPDSGGLLSTKGRLYVVCDGMGGHAAGEVASQIAVKTIGRAYFSERSPLNPAQALKLSVEAANGEIYEEARRNPDREGMGTTLSALSLVGRSAVVANVGDSRTYMIRDGAITQISQDHSWVMEQVRAGGLTPEQAENHPYSNVITRSLGSKSSVDVDIFGPIDVMPGDIFLLMSDGLSGLVKDGELLNYALSHPPEEAARQMVRLAKERGGHDNITIQIVRINRVSGKRLRRAGVKVKVTKRSVVVAAGVATLFVAALVVAAALIMSKIKPPEGPVDTGPPPIIKADVINPKSMVFGDGKLYLLDMASIVTYDPTQAEGTDTTEFYINEIPISEEFGKPLALTYTENISGDKVLGVMCIAKGEKKKYKASLHTYNLSNNKWSEGLSFDLPNGDIESPAAVTVLDGNIYFIFSGGLHWASKKGNGKIEKEWELEDPTAGFASPFSYQYKPSVLIYVDGGRFYRLNSGVGAPMKVCGPGVKPFPEKIVDIDKIGGENGLFAASKKELFRVNLVDNTAFKIPAPVEEGEIAKVAAGGNIVYLLVKGDDLEYKIIPVEKVLVEGEPEPLCK